MGPEERPATTPSTDLKADGHDDSEDPEPDGIDLINGECVLACLDLHRGLKTFDQELANSMLLTESRLICFAANTHEPSASVISLRDVTEVSVESKSRGPSSYIWGLIAIILAFLLWRIIEHQVGSIAAGASVAAMGIYLIADAVLSPYISVVFFLAGKSRDLRRGLSGRKACSDVYAFIAHIYARKEEIATSERSAFNTNNSYERRSRYANKVLGVSDVVPRLKDQE